MTNEQLRMLLSRIVSNLNDALEIAIEELQDFDIPRNTEEIYIGNNKFHFAIGKRNPNDYKTITTTPLALNKLKDTIAALAYETKQLNETTNKFLNNEEEKINEKNRLILTKLEKEIDWHIVINPFWGSKEEASHIILLNMYNEYVETKNCGVIYRMIRIMDAPKYNIALDEIPLKAILFKNGG